MKAAVCYGYGGVTSVVVAVLKRLGVDVYITGRRRDAAARRAEELGAKLFDEGEGGGARSCVQLFVNAAPVTDAPLEEAPHFLAALEGCSVAFDHELVGATLRAECASRGVRHIPGKAMYWPQMTAQWELFLGGGGSGGGSGGGGGGGGDGGGEGIRGEGRGIVPPGTDIGQLLRLADERSRAEEG